MLLDGIHPSGLFAASLGRLLADRECTELPDGTRLTVVDGVPVAVPAPEFAQQTPVGVVPNPQFFVTDDV